MGSDTGIISNYLLFACFNPRSRMGSDKTFVDGFIYPPVSIHAPAWGATEDGLPDKDRYEFQSTLPHGERPGWTASLEVREKVSIHAPAWGATRIMVCLNTPYEFQSTLPHGERPSRPDAREMPSRFQSTLPHGERQSRPG